MTFSEAHPCRVDSLLRIGYAEGWLEINKHYDNDYIPPLYWRSVQVGDSIYTMCDTLLQVPYDTDVTIEPVAIDFRYPASIRYATVWMERAGGSYYLPIGGIYGCRGYRRENIV